MALSFFLLDGPGAWAAEPSKAGAAEKFCGISTREAIAAAEKSLAAKDADAQSCAFACLIVATKALDAAQVIVKRGTDQHEMLHLPGLSARIPVNDIEVTPCA